MLIDVEGKEVRKSRLDEVMTDVRHVPRYDLTIDEFSSFAVIGELRQLLDGIAFGQRRGDRHALCSFPEPGIASKCTRRSTAYRLSAGSALWQAHDAAGIRRLVERQCHIDRRAGRLAGYLRVAVLLDRLGQVAHVLRVAL